jgi:serine/threonine-protein kinase
VAGYRIEERVGSGGMAMVFRARDESLGRTVALKVLAPTLAEDQAFRERFIRESRAAAAVDHPNIIPVYSAGEAGGVLYIAMRFVAAGDLREVCRREGPLTAERAAFLLSPIASALDAAHAVGLVHRDVKPANILVDSVAGRPDHPYLSDFGLAKGAAASGLTGTGQFLGTADYAAPEQIAGEPADPRTDQYALACVAFNVLTGTAPYTRDQPMAVLWAHMQAAPPSVTALRPDLPAAVDQVMARAMAKNANDRYPSCAEFSDALRAALGVGRYADGRAGDVSTIPLGRPGGFDAAAVHPSVPPYPSDLPSPAGAWENPWQPVAVAQPADGIGQATNPTLFQDSVADTPGWRRGTSEYGAGQYGAIFDTPPGRTRPRTSPAPRVALVVTAVLVAGVAATVALLLPGTPSQRLPGTRTSAPARVTSSAGTVGGATPAASLPGQAPPKLSGKPFTIPGSVPLLISTFKADGSLITVGVNDTAYIWDLPTHTVTAQLTAPRGHEFRYAALSPEGTAMLAQDTTGTMYFFQGTETPGATLPGGGGGRVYPGSVSAGGFTLATEDRAQTGADIWAGINAAHVATLTNPDHGARVTSIAVGGDGKTVAISDTSGKTVLWDTNSASRIRTLAPSDGSAATCSAISFSRTVLVTGQRDGRAYLWNPASGQSLGSVPGADGAVDEVALSLDGHLLATAGTGSQIRLWDTLTRTLIATLNDPEGAGVSSLAINFQGSLLAVADRNGKTYLWSTPFV